MARTKTAHIWFLAVNRRRAQLIECDGALVRRRPYPEPSAVDSSHPVPTRFVNRVAVALNRARDGDRFESLVLIGSTGFLALLRAGLDPLVIKSIRAELPSEFARMSDRRLIAAIDSLDAAADG